MTQVPQSPLDVLLGAGALQDKFPPNSRYHGVATSSWTTPDGRSVPYLERRFVPQPYALELMLEHTVSEGERLDHIAHRHLGDPELFWRVCDANGALRPRDLTQTVGRRLRIALPQGVPGGRDV